MVEQVYRQGNRAEPNEQNERSKIMISRAAHINKTQLKKVNRALAAAGCSEYPGDRTTAQPEGCRSGYVSNLLDYLAAGQPSEQQRIWKIINDTLRY